MNNSRRAVGAIAVASALALAGCSTQPPAASDTTLSIRIPFAPGSWNPLDGAVAYSTVLQAVYDPLLRLTPEGELAPWLAESFELSDDGRTLSLELRDDVDYIDGLHMNAETVARSLDRLLHPEGTQPGAAQLIAYGTEVEVTGEYGLELTTDRPMRGEWTTWIASTPIVSPDALDDPDILAAGPVGTGAYLVDEIVAETSITYVRNPDYWNADAFPFDTVEMTVFVDDVAALNALQSGQIDAAYIVDLGLAVGAVDQPRDPGLLLNTGQGLAPSIYFTDRAGTVVPALADVRVRRAINMAFDRESINESLNFGLGDVRSQPFVPSEPAYVEGGDERYPYDLERARELMAEAGYEDGFELRIASVTGFTTSYEPVLQQSLADIGITVVYDTIPLAEFGTLFTERWKNLDYPVVAYPLAVGATRFGWIHDYFGGYPEPEAAAYFDAMIEGSNAEAAEAAREFGEYILDNAWFAPFSAPPCVVVSREGLPIEIGLSTPDGNSMWTPFWSYAMRA